MNTKIKLVSISQFQISIPQILSVYNMYFSYRISSVIRRSFFSFQNNPKDLDSSYKTDLDLWDCLGRVKLVL